MGDIVMGLMTYPMRNLPRNKECLAMARAQHIVPKRYNILDNKSTGFRPKRSDGYSVRAAPIHAPMRTSAVANCFSASFRLKSTRIDPGSSSTMQTFRTEILYPHTKEESVTTNAVHLRKFVLFDSSFGIKFIFNVASSADIFK